MIVSRSTPTPRLMKQDSIRTVVNHDHNSIQSISNNINSNSNINLMNLQNAEGLRRIKSDDIMFNKSFVR